MITRILEKTIKSSVFGFARPTHLILHVTGRCNARCGACFAWKRLGEKNDLTLGEFEKIAKSLPNLIFLDISGGEPFLRNDLDKILTIFAKSSPSAYVNLPTNGLLPGKIAKVTEKILKNTTLPISLNLSLDGLEKTHDKMRQVEGCFQKVLLTYEKLAKLKKNYPRLSLKVATVITNQNLEELEDFANFVKKKMPKIDFHTLILVRGQPRQKNVSLPSLSQLEDKRSLFFQIWENYDYGKNLGRFGSKVANVSHRYLFDLYLKTLKERKMTLPCLAGKAHGVIFANGDVSFCELKKPIGNLRKVNFDFFELWQGREAQEQRRKIFKNECFCTNGCNWTDNLFFNFRSYPKLLGEILKS